MTKKQIIEEIKQMNCKQKEMLLEVVVYYFDELSVLSLEKFRDLMKLAEED